MSKTMAIVGAGPGVGLAVAHRFGREGYRIALISRNEAKLRGFVKKLSEVGIDAAAFPADVLDHKQLKEALNQVKRTLGPIDVLEYSPVVPHASLVPPLNINVDNALYHFAFGVLGPIVCVGEVLPDMLKNGDGGLLFTTAASAVHPVPFSSNFGISASGLRSYTTSLHHALAPAGVYAGIVMLACTVGDDSLHDPGPLRSESAPPRIPTVPAREIAERHWKLYTARDRIEDIAGDMEMVYQLLGIEGR